MATIHFFSPPIDGSRVVFDLSRADVPPIGWTDFRTLQEWCTDRMARMTTQPLATVRHAGLGARHCREIVVDGTTIPLMKPFFRRDEFHESLNSCGISYIQGLAELGPAIYEMPSSTPATNERISRSSAAAGINRIKPTYSGAYLDLGLRFPTQSQSTKADRSVQKTLVARRAWIRLKDTSSARYGSVPTGLF